MAYLEISGSGEGKTLYVGEKDLDGDIELEIRNEYTGDVLNLYISISKTKELVYFLQNQIKDL